MRKILVSAILALFSISVCFGISTGDVWFAPYPAGFNVNLADTATYTGAVSSSDPSKAKPFEENGYTGTTMIGLVGVSSSSEWGTVTVKVEIETKGTKNGYYYSASEPDLKRPFAIDLVACKLNGGNSSRPVKRIGYGGTGASGEIELTPGRKTTDILGIPYGNYEGWLDIVLYLPTGSSADFNSALSADDYYCGLKITVYEGETEIISWDYNFNGYITQRPNTDVAQIFFNIAPDAKARSMSLTELFRGDSVEIGTYLYETQSFLDNWKLNSSSDSLSYAKQINNAYRLVATSTNEPFGTSNKEFRMYYEGDTTAESFPFVIKLTSKITSGETPDYSVFTGEAVSEDAGLKAKIVESHLGDNHGGDSGDRVVYFRDEGFIELSVPQDYIDNKDDKGLSENWETDFPAGMYSSTVYFHIISTQ